MAVPQHGCTAGSEYSHAPPCQRRRAQKRREKKKSDGRVQRLQESHSFPVSHRRAAPCPAAHRALVDAARTAADTSPATAPAGRRSRGPRKKTARRPASGARCDACMHQRIKQNNGSDADTRASSTGICCGRQHLRVAHRYLLRRIQQHLSVVQRQLSHTKAGALQSRATMRSPPRPPPRGPRRRARPLRGPGPRPACPALPPAPAGAALRCGGATQGAANRPNGRPGSVFFSPRLHAASVFSFSFPNLVYLPARPSALSPVTFRACTADSATPCRLSLGRLHGARTDPPSPKAQSRSPVAMASSLWYVRGPGRGEQV